MEKLIVIGGGPGGNMAALAAARHGAEGVVLVEKAAMGGTCTNRGCIPTKFLLSRLPRDRAPQSFDSGSWKNLMRHKNALVRGLSSSIHKSCRKAGVKVLQGHGRLKGKNQVEVTSEGGEKSLLEAESIIIASGSSPAEIPGISIDRVNILSSTEALELPAPPRSVVIVGSGAVGSEFASILHRAGTKVTVVEAMDRLFPGEDPEVHRLFAALYDRLGVEYVVGDGVLGAEPGRGGELKIMLRSGSILQAEKVLLAAGRNLDSDDLGLTEAGIATGPAGEIHVDEELRTSVPNIFAVGDVTGKMLLAHLASFQGVQAGRRATGKSARPIPYHAVPWTIFTTPEIASVGLNESEASRREMECYSAIVPWMDNIKARIDRMTDGFVKIVADSSGVLLGGTLVGGHAAEMIHILSGAIHRRATVSDIAGMVFAHPGLAETIFEAAQALQHRLPSSPTS